MSTGTKLPEPEPIAFTETVGQRQNALANTQATNPVETENAQDTDTNEQIMVDVKQIERNAVRREFGFLMTAEKKKRLSEFVERNIHGRQCTNYIPSDKAPKKPAESNRSSLNVPPSCGCGHTYEWHVAKGCAGTETHQVKKSHEKWNSAKHSKDVVTPSYGQISFIGFNGGDSRYQAPYVRISANTSAKVVWDLVSKHWDLPPPQLLLSITGGAKRFFNKDKETQIFKKELIDAVKATGAWVLTGGLGAGVMQYVGQAVSEYAASVGSTERHKLVLIGVCPWGAVDGMDLLTNEQGGGLFPARYDAANLPGLSASESCTALDNNHTHFIFVDDGSVKKYGTEIAWRASFEKYVGSHVKTGVDKEQSINVPVVQLLVNGGPGTLETASQAVINGTPLIVIDGTKRAAELLATAYRLTKDVTQWDEKADASFLEKIVPVMHRTLNTAKPEEQQHVLAIVKRRNLVTVFTLESLFGEQTLDRKILQALMKASKADPKAQLSLALAWNKPDFARTEILTSAFDYKSLGGGRLHEPLFYSLINNQHQFVQLFLDCGIDLQGFLTMDRIARLYAEVLELKDKDSRSELMQTLIDRQTPRKKANGPVQLAYIGEILTDLIGSYYPNEYKAETSKQAASLLSDGNAKREREYELLSCPEKHLLLWAILFCRRELALMFWRSGINHIGTALMASKVAAELADIAADDGMDDLSAEYRDMTETFEELACAVLRECYERNKQLTFLCLTRQISNLGNATALIIADDAEHEVFMEHTSCQLKLSRIWKGNMVLNTPEWKLILTALLPFIFLPMLHFVRKDSKHQRSDERKFDDLSEFKKGDSQDNMQTDGAADGPFMGRGRVGSTAAIIMDDFTMPSNDNKRHQPSKHYTVSLTGRSHSKISYFTAMKYFLTAPVTKFIYNVMSYFTFLVLFSIFLLTELGPSQSVSILHPYEPLIWIWAISFILEEIRQIASRPGSSIKHKIEKWWSSDWNKIDSAMYTLLLLAVILRFNVALKDFVYARMAYVVAGTLFVIRCTQMFFVYKQIGPKIIMIGRMLRDLFFFIFILSVFMVAFGIAYRALLYPNAELNGALLGNIFYNAYFIIFGQVPLSEVILGSVSGCNSSITSEVFGIGDACPNENWLAGIYLAIYCLIANILLINLLIAMFSFTVQSIQEHSERLWKYNRYSLIYEFFDRPPLPYPFIVLAHFYGIGVAIYNRCLNASRAKNDDFQVLLTDEETQRVVSFERVAMESHMNGLSRREKENITTKVHTTSQRIEKVLEDIDDIKENITQIFASSKEEKGRLTVSDGPLAAELVMEKLDIGKYRLPNEPKVSPTSSGNKARGNQEPNIARLQEDVCVLGDRLQSMDESMRNRIDAIQTRFNDVNDRFDALSAKLSQQMETFIRLTSRPPDAYRVTEANNKLAQSSASDLTPVDLDSNE